MNFESLFEIIGFLIGQFILNESHRIPDSLSFIYAPELLS